MPGHPHFLPVPRPARPAGRLRGAAAFATILAALLPGTAQAENDLPSTDSGEAITAVATNPTPVASPAAGGEWVVAPIPSLDPAQGFGLALVAQHIFQTPGHAEGTPPSIFGIGAFYNSQKSYGVVAGYLGHWRDDLWRPTLGGGYVDVNIDYYGTGNDLADLGISLPLEQKMTLGLAQLLRRVRPGVYAGLRVAATAITVETDGVDQPPVTFPPTSRNNTSIAGGPVLQWDTRDNQFYPTAGHLLNAHLGLHGGDQVYQIYQADWNSYVSLGESSVLAFRAFVRATAGDAPFYALSRFGNGNDLRGYKSGKYRDRDMVAVQFEWRRRLSRRWGYVVFAGAGEVAADFGDLNTDDILPSAGAGLRFRLAESQPVNFRLDGAWGKDGGTVYLGVNEAF